MGRWRAAALKDGVEWFFLQHLLSVERCDDETARNSIGPAWRNRAVGVAIKVFRPRQRMRHTRACFASQTTNGGFDETRLLNRFVHDCHRTAGHRALETFKRPRPLPSGTDRRHRTNAREA